MRKVEMARLIGQGPGRGAARKQAVWAGGNLISTPPALETDLFAQAFGTQDRKEASAFLRSAREIRGR